MKSSLSLQIVSKAAERLVSTPLFGSDNMGSRTLGAAS